MINELKEQRQKLYSEVLSIEKQISKLTKDILPLHYGFDVGDTFETNYYSKPKKYVVKYLRERSIIGYAVLKDGTISKHVSVVHVSEGSYYYKKVEEEEV